MAHYSIQDHHARFPKEARGKACLASGVEPSAGERESGPRRGVPLARGRASARVARCVNRVFGRVGPVPAGSTMR